MLLFLRENPGHRRKKALERKILGLGLRSGHLGEALRKRGLCRSGAAENGGQFTLKVSQ